MRSFDFWDTLVARRSVHDVYNETNNVFPIAETVSRVKPGDIIISDYYDAELVKKLLPEITGLNNEAFITKSGKGDGSIWEMLKKKGFNIECHMGDNSYSDVKSPKLKGIPAELFYGSKLTTIEEELYNAGMKGLALTMREARLLIWDKKLRPLQILQTQINFPQLFIASLLIHRTNPEKLLMCSRDCFLWHNVQKVVRDMCKGTYEVVYFHTSRFAIKFPRPGYFEYVSNLLPATIVDLAATGASLLQLREWVKQPDTPVVLFARYPSETPDGKIRQMLQIPDVNPENIMHLEFLNFARHPVYIDESTTFNPSNIDWAGIAEIKIAHDAFLKACEVSKYYDFSSDLAIDNDTLQDLLHKCFDNIRGKANVLGFAGKIFGKEEKEQRAILKGQVEFITDNHEAK